MEDVDRCFIKETEIVARNIAGQTIVVPVKSRVGDLDSIYTLNEIGTMIWDLLDGGRPAKEMVDALTEEYDVEAAEAKKDVFDFLGSLEEAGLIKPFRA